MAGGEIPPENSVERLAKNILVSMRHNIMRMENLRTIVQCFTDHPTQTPPLHLILGVCGVEDTVDLHGVGCGDAKIASTFFALSACSLYVPVQAPLLSSLVPRATLSLGKSTPGLGARSVWFPRERCV